MPTINIQADVSVEMLVKAAEQLSETELRHFTSQILALHAKRTAPSVTQAEAAQLVSGAVTRSARMDKTARRRISVCHLVRWTSL